MAAGRRHWSPDMGRPGHSPWNPWLAGLFLLMMLCAGGSRAEPFSEPMDFTLHQPCESGACEQYLLARGAVDPDTPGRFREAWQFLRARQEFPRIYFHSPGGNLQAALELGRLIRAAGLDTRVGGPYLEGNGIGQPPRVLVRQAACVSACAYAFLGGVSRSLGENALFGLHQFFAKDGDIGDSPTQIMMAMLGSYLDEMGVDRRFLDFAATTVPDQIKPLPRSLARDLNVDNQHPPQSPWRLEAGAAGDLVASVAQRVPGSDAEFMLRVWSGGRRLAGEARWRARQGRISESELAEEFSVRGSPDLVFRTPSGREVTVVSEGWRRGENGWFVAPFDPGPDFLALLEKSGEVEFLALATSPIPDISPRARFSTQGFTNALRALER